MTVKATWLYLPNMALEFVKFSLHLIPGQFSLKTKIKELLTELWMDFFKTKISD